MADVPEHGAWRSEIDDLIRRLVIIWQRDLSSILKQHRVDKNTSKYFRNALAEVKVSIYSELKPSSTHQREYLESKTDNRVASLLKKLTEILYDNKTLEEYMRDDIGYLIDQYASSLRRQLNSLRSIIGDEFPPPRNTLRNTIPLTRSAPVQVNIVNNRLQLNVGQTEDGSLSRTAVQRMLQSLAETMETALKVLGNNHNADCRFSPSCQPFLRYLRTPLDELSIESLGYNRQIVALLMDEHRETLPPTIAIQIDHVLKSSNVVLNQFREWQAYLTEETIVGLSKDDMKSVVQETEQVARDLSSSENVDPDIAERLLEMISPVASGIIRADTIATPLVGSLSNILASMASIVLEASPAVTELAISVVKSASFHHSLPLLAVTIIAGIAPKLGNLQPFRFLKDAHELAKEKFPWAKDLLSK